MANTEPNVSAAAPAPSRRSEVQPFHAMDVLAAANLREAAGASVLHMEVGQPGRPRPDP